jgi:hypothetical protein
MSIHDSDRIKQLMMASIDGESTPEEEAELKQMLIQDRELAEEYQQLKNLKIMTSQTRIKEPPSELWDSYSQTLFVKLERGIGWILFTIGALVLLFYGAWLALSDLLTDPGIAWWLKASIVALVSGCIVLLVSLIRERIYMNKHERYKDVIR